MKNKVPKLRFPEFSGEWEEKKLEEICDKSIEKNKQNIIKTVFSNSAKYGVVLQNDFFDREITTEANQDNYYIVKPDSFVYNPRISQSAPVGPVSINKTGLIGIVSPLYTIFNLKENSFVNKEYLEIYFMTNKWHGYLKSVANTGARHDRMNITDSQLFKLPISISNSTEQEKIASFLSKVDESIEILEEEKELWEKYKKGMMQKIFSQKLRFKDENGNDYPEWEEKILENITDYVDYRGKTPTKTESGVFLVTAKNIKMGYIDYKTSKEFISQESYDEAMRRGLPKIGDVLFTTEAPMGNVAQVDNENIALAQRVIKFRGKSILNNTFLKYSFINDKFQNELLNNAIGTTVLGIQGKVLHKMKINIPSLPEQEKIANFLSSIDEKIELIEKDLQGVKEFKKGLLQQMFV